MIACSAAPSQMQATYFEIDLLRKRNRHHTEPLTEDMPGLTVELDNANHLVNCILKLPSLQRQVIWLKYHHGYSLREISKMLNRSLAWAIKTDQRAKAKLLSTFALVKAMQKRLQKWDSAKGVR